MKDKPWKEAIIKVIRENGGAMSRTEVAEAIVANGLRKNVGSTPANTVVSYISTSMKDDANSPFLRVGRGEYTLRELIESKSVKEEIPSDEREGVSGAINAYGMFWSRDLVFWQRNPKLLGQQQLGANPVDMSNQIGIYLLYDGRDIIYVGRAIERGLGQRLYEHTQDRLRARWNRFSWFGVFEVSEKGKLKDELTTLNTDIFVQMLESVLIEALEPPQNRKRGDYFSAIEYVQNEDPKIEKNRKLALLSQMQSNLLD